MHTNQEENFASCSKRQKSNIEVLSVFFEDQSLTFRSGNEVLLGLSKGMEDIFFLLRGI